MHVGWMEWGNGEKEKEVGGSGKGRGGKRQLERMGGGKEPPILAQA